MTRAQVILTDYSGYDDPNFVMLAGRVLDGVQHHADYPTPPRPLGEVQQLLDQVAGAALALQAGRPRAADRRRHARARAEAALRALSIYCTAATPGRSDLWAAACFPLVDRPARPRPRGGPVTGLALTAGPTPRTLAARADAPAGPGPYAWRVFRADTPPAQLAAGFCYRLCLTPQPHALLNDLDSDTTYGVECAAWGGPGALQWSPPAFGQAR